MDYYEPMMPFRRLTPFAFAVFATLLSPAFAQAPSATPEPSPEPAAQAPSEPGRSLMDAQLFYEVLLGELNARNTDPATAFALLLDSARRTNDARLYQRAMEVALQARSGESALQAARNWRLAIPDSVDANRYELQILIAMNRIQDTAPSLRHLLELTPADTKTQALAGIVPLYARASDRPLAAKVVEDALERELKDPQTGADAWITIGRMRLAAGQQEAALEAARKAQEIKPESELPSRLALELMAAKMPAAETLIQQHLDTYAQPELRIAYARGLIEDQRYTEAQQQLAKVTQDRADLPEPWLILGAMQAEENQQAAGIASLNRFLELAKNLPDADLRERGQSQAYLALAQLAEKRKDFKSAESWLAKVNNPALQLTAQTRRASLLAAQGHLGEAQAVLDALPHGTPAEVRVRLNAQVQLLRDQKLYQAAYDVLAKASADAPDDMDVVYDQAMMAEKLGQYELMEKLLRNVIAAQPDSQNAYNALGYSLADRGVRLDEARQLITKALEFAPGDPFISDSLGWVEFKAGHFDQALGILDKAFKSKPDPEIAAHLGEVLWTLGHKAQAQAVWKQGLGLNADNETLLETLQRLHAKP
ncbi:MAG: tetratricopeptide repeat protein [Curvibacter sp.]|nr:tetratricopeptide repeat protein [Curvibacter sp.]